jgi:glycosyltransferase involved in cell wall biosynthesis
MRISIVTPTRNQAEFIRDTIHSVMDQDHDDIEHVVVDGASTDGTVDILKEFPHLRWLSEPDSGQSNAINKGFRLATGEILAWLNSDDYYEKNVLGAVARYFRDHPDCMILYGDITYVDQEKNFLYALNGPAISYQELIKSPDIMRQPSFFWRRRVIEEIGFIDERFHLVMDFEFFLRAAKRYPLHYLPRTISCYRSHPESKTISLLRRQVPEFFHAYRKQGIAIGFRGYKFLFGRYLDSLDPSNPVRLAFGLLRKKPRKAR